MATNCNCQTENEQGVLPGCAKCMNGDVCKEMYEALKKISNWLGILAKQAETQLKTCNFITLREALEFDIKNYKATRENINKALSKAEEK